MRVVFMGTPDFAVKTLQAVMDAGHEVVLVVTQPDKPKGRGKALSQSRVREAECVAYIGGFCPDMVVVAAFGQILPKGLLELPRFGCVNVHASLLPQYRGAAPIQWSVINGDRVSGITTMRMDEGLDTGDIIAYRG